MITLQPEKVEREYTLFYHYTVLDKDGKEIPLIVKLPRENWMTTLNEIVVCEDLREVAKEHAEILQKIDYAVRNSGIEELDAIRVPGLLPEFCAIVMENLPFITFKQKNLTIHPPFRTRKYWQEVSKEIRLAGKWLRIFHETFDQDEEVTIEELKVDQQAEKYFDDIEAFCGQPNSRLRHEFMEIYDQVKDTKVHTTILHNDLHLNNIFITSEGKVGGYDPIPGNIGTIYLDLARALTDPLSKREQLISHGNFYSRKYLDRLRGGFLEGYGEERIDHQLLNFYCALEGLKKLWEYEEILTSPKVSRIPGLQRIGRFNIHRYVKKYIRGFLNGKKQKTF
ncbi:MAG: phosphotransferase [Anaerolineales bacterium]